MIFSPEFWAGFELHNSFLWLNHTKKVKFIDFPVILDERIKAITQSKKKRKAKDDVITK